MNNHRYLGSSTLASKLRQCICLAITQPMTATQISERLGKSFSKCSKALLGLKSHKIMKCLNPAARRNRMFWLTATGKKLRRHLSAKVSSLCDLSQVGWKSYAQICFSQRSQVIQTLAFAMQPSEIKRKTTRRVSGCRMSANNVRDVIRYLKANGIVRPVRLKKKAHPGYVLTKIGLQMRTLLLRVCHFPQGK